jgi:peptide/nickel transport system substrate-binding protein
VWTIKLRQDKKWSNGDPVTARDYYASWIRFMGPELKDSPMWAGPWGNIEEAYAFKAGAATAEEVGVKLLDDYTLEVRLVQPNASFPNLLAVPSTMPINAASLEANPSDWWDPSKAVYNGPYTVKEWTSSADITLARNPTYVGDGLGNVGTIVLRPYQDANARLQAFENEEIQFTFVEDASQLQYARNNPLMSENLKEEIHNLSWQGIQFNRALDAGPLSDVRVRQAFALAIDKEAITNQVMQGLAIPTHAFSGEEAVKSKVTPLAYDVEKAKQLLADAGFPNGQGMPPLTFYAPPANDPRMPMIEAVTKMWQDNLGVQITIQNNENAVYSTLQWSDYNKDIQPGFSTLGGAVNWFQPADLLMSSNHIWFFMDYKPGGMATYADYKEQIAAVPNLEAPGDWAELETRANTAWTTRQEQAAKENNERGQDMMIAPTFKDQWDVIAQRYNDAADDEAKLGAYKDALALVLALEQAVAQYEDMNESNHEAQRLMAKMTRQPLDQATETAVPVQQLGVDSAWMIPIYNQKLFYTTDPRLSNVVLNKLAWGNLFQYQYLQWNE